MLDHTIFFLVVCFNQEGLMKKDRSLLYARIVMGGLVVFFSLIGWPEAIFWSLFANLYLYDVNSFLPWNKEKQPE